jgi:hypothetical protein
VLRLALGALVLTAVVLKTHALVTQPAVGTGLLASRWLVLAVVQVELLVAFWLIAGIWPTWAWRSSVALFAVFCVVSLAKAMAGEASCGCFGRFAVSPWITSALSGVIVGALFAIRASVRREERRMAAAPSRGARRFLSLRGAIVAVGATCMAGVAVLALSNDAPQPGEPYEGRTILGRRVVALVPNQWVGQPFRHLESVDIGGELSHGKWLVVLFSERCGRCKKTIGALQSGEAPSDWQVADRRIALVSITGGTSSTYGVSNEKFISGALDPETEWVVTPPVVFWMDDGIVSRMELP